MPLLREERSVHPEALFEDPECRQADACWWAFYTVARQEKSLARHLLVREIPFFLPVIKKVTVYRGRRCSSYVPLFSGYIFLHGTEDQRRTALTGNHVSQVLEVHDQETLHRDLTRIWRLIQSDAILTPERRIQPGRRVRVRAGALAGLEGSVLKRRGETRFLVSIDFLQQGASLQLDDYLLEPLE
jgi:hypothetical protein